MTEPARAVELRNVDIVFGKEQKAALRLLDEGCTREEILVRTGAVVGAAGVNLSIARGEIFVLMGLSGSGKSTVLRAINRLNEVTRGELNVQHQGCLVDVARCGARTLRDLRRHTVSMVFQQFGLLPWRTVRENVALGLELRGTPARQRARTVEEKLTMVGLDAWADRAVSELSGGMQQRVGLARAFATDADILLMDEPFSALDPLIRGKLQDELLALQQRIPKTIIFVSHDLDEALKLGNRIAIMESGRIVQTGTAEDILLRPANGYVAEFVKHMNPMAVLRASAVMREASSLTRDGDAVLLDRIGEARLRLGREGEPLAIEIGGRKGRLVRVEAAGSENDLDPERDGDAIIAPGTLKLKAAIALKRHTNLPLILLDEAGRLAGLCGDEEIYRALLRRVEG